MPEPTLPEHYQHGYVTTDIERAKAVFAEDYGELAWTGFDSNLRLKAPRDTHMELKIAMAQVGRLQIGIIQPIAGEGARLYVEALPAEGFGLVLHHLGYRLTGPAAAWEAFRGRLGDEIRPIALEGETSTTKFVYIDSRTRLGHYSEYVWAHTPAA